MFSTVKMLCEGVPRCVRESSTATSDIAQATGVCQRRLAAFTPKQSRAASETSTIPTAACTRMVNMTRLHSLDSMATPPQGC